MQLTLRCSTPTIGSDDGKKAAIFVAAIELKDKKRILNCVSVANSVDGLYQLLSGQAIGIRGASLSISGSHEYFPVLSQNDIKSQGNDILVKESLCFQERFRGAKKVTLNGCNA